MAHHFTDNSIFLNSFSNSSDPNTVMAPNFNPLLNPAELETPTWSIHSIMGFSQESFFTHESSEISTNLSANIQGFSATEPENGCLYHVVGNKKKLVLETPESSWANSSPPDSENGITIKNRAGKEKKQKSNFRNEEKRKDVVHVRARRGQATDSHSLAERVRRNKINEKLRCLQDIVPGCHKTVGMAAMLDEIINYVQSLQNQVEFLSMKLTAASNFQDFNAETDTMNMMIQRAKAWESEIIKQKMLREIFEEKSENGEYGFSSNEGGPFDHSFGSYPLLPNNK